MSKNLILALSILFILACSGSQAEKAGGQPSYAVGQDVIVGEIRWKILEAKELGPELKSENQFIEPKKTSGKFVLVRLEVENRKDDMATYGGIDLVDDRNREFTRYDEQFGFIPEAESCVLENINPSISRVCSEIFELPADAAGLRAKVGDLELLGGDEAFVELGF